MAFVKGSLYCDVTQMPGCRDNDTSVSAAASTGNLAGEDVQGSHTVVALWTPRQLQRIVLMVHMTVVLTFGLLQFLFQDTVTD